MQMCQSINKKTMAPTKPKWLKKLKQMKNNIRDNMAWRKKMRQKRRK